MPAAYLKTHPSFLRARQPTDNQARLLYIRLLETCFPELVSEYRHRPAGGDAFRRNKARGFGKQIYFQFYFRCRQGWQQQAKQPIPLIV